MIGRDAELAAAASFLRDPLTTSAALVVQGEAGIGKSTILGALLEDAVPEGSAVLTARLSASERELPYAALGDLLIGIADEAMSSLVPPQRHAIAVALGRADGTVDTHALSRGVLELLRSAAGARSLLLVFDDVQWLDRPSASAASFALRRLSDARLRVLLALRTGEEVPAELLGVAAWKSVRRLVIGPMSATELGAVLRDRLGERLPRPRLEAIHRTSNGNPMFALELARPGRDEWRAGTTLPGEVSARLQTIDRRARTALSVGALALRPSSDLLLGAGVDRDDLRAALESGMLEVSGDHLVFAHPLLASAAEALVLPDERLAIHARLAAATADPVERGYHVARAVVGPNEAAADVLDRAAAEAANLSDHVGAAAFLLRAAELTPEAHVDAAQARELKAVVELERSGDIAAAATLARGLIDRLPAGAMRARARLLLVDCTVGPAMPYGDALAELLQALDDAQDDIETRAELHAQIAEQLTAMCRLDAALAHGNTALELADRARAEPTAVKALANVGFTECMLGRGVTQAAREAMRRWDRRSFATTTYSPRMALACELLYTGVYEQAEQLFFQELTAAEELGIEPIEVMARSLLAEMQLRAGRWADGLQGARLAYEHARQAADAQIITGTLYALAMAWALLGEQEEARTLATEGLADAEATGDFWYTNYHRGVLGLVALADGDPQSAVDILTPAWAAMVERGLGELSIFPVAQVLGEAQVAVGRIADAEGIVEALRACPAGERPWCRAMAGRVDALVASARGDHPAARTAITAALEAHGELEEPFEHARTLHVAGRIERTARNWGAARAALGAALERFDELGAARWSERVAADLARLPGRRPADAHTLTTREREIAELVAAGLANKEIAARLFLSVRTIEANLSKVYAKLGVHTRTELANLIR